MNNLLILHPEKGYSYKDLIEALNDIKFRGKYFNFVKNNPIFKKYIENVLEYNFGPRVTIHKINQEKKQGFKFPIKTKESLENFLQDLNIKLNKLHYNINEKENTLEFPLSRLFNEFYLKKILGMVLNYKKIPYNIEIQENLQKINEVKYEDIFKPETLSKLNKQSADNLRRVKQEFDLMDQMAYLKLLQDIMRIEEPYKQQLEQLAVNMVEDLYPVIEEQGIRIDAGLTDMNGTRAELDEIKVNTPTPYKYEKDILPGLSVLDLKINSPDSIFYRNLLKKYNYYDGSVISFFTNLSNTNKLNFYKDLYGYLTKNNITPDYSAKMSFGGGEEDLDESISPEGRRRVINAITQGASLKGAFSFYLFKDHLDAIDPTLVEKYNEVMKRTFGVYDDDNIIAMMMAMLARGVDLKGSAGGSSKVIINEIKVNNPVIKLDTFIKLWNEIPLSIENIPKKQRILYKYDFMRGGVVGKSIQSFFQELHPIQKQNIYKDVLELKNSLSLNESQESGITIRARAICFPMLVHEIIKGLYELISLQGFKGDKQQNQAVVDKVDKLEHEPHDLRYGQQIFEALNDIYFEYGGDDSRVREYFFQEIYQLEDEDFIEYIENAINGTLTPQEKSWTKQVIKEIILDLKSDDFEASGLQESILNKGLLASLLLSAGLTYSQLKPEYKAKIDSIQKVQTLNPQQKRAEIQKIVQLNRDEISGKHRADFLKVMAASGFTDEEEYKKYLAKNAKKKPVPLSGLEIGNANKRGETKGSCSTGQSNRGESLKDTK